MSHQSNNTNQQQKKIGGFVFKKNTTSKLNTNTTSSSSAAAAVAQQQQQQQKTSNINPLSSVTNKNTEDDDNDSDNDTSSSSSSSPPYSFKTSFFNSLSTAPRTIIPGGRGRGGRPLHCSICQELSHSAGTDCPRYRSLLCRHWAAHTGNCPRGDQCCYAHPLITFSSPQEATAKWEELMRKNLSYGAAMSICLLDGFYEKSIEKERRHYRDVIPLFQKLGIEWKPTESGSSNEKWTSMIASTHEKIVKFRKSFTATKFYRTPEIFALATANDGDCLEKLLNGHSCIVSGIPLERFRTSRNYDYEYSMEIRTDSSENPNEVFIQLTSVLLEAFPSLLYFSISPTALYTQTMKYEEKMKNYKSSKDYNLKTVQQSFTFATVIVGNEQDLFRHCRHSDSVASAKTAFSGSSRITLKFPDPTVTTARQKSYSLDVKFYCSNRNQEQQEQQQQQLTQQQDPVVANSRGGRGRGRGRGDGERGRGENNKNKKQNNNNNNNHDDTTQHNKRPPPALFTTNVSLLFKILSYFDKSHAGRRDLTNFALTSKTFLETFISYRASYLMKRATLSSGRSRNNGKNGNDNRAPTDSTFIQVLRMARVFSPDHLQYYLGTLEGLIGIPPRQFLRAALKSSSPYIFNQVFKRFLPRVESPLAVASALSDRTFISSLTAESTSNDNNRNSLFDPSPDSDFLYLKQILKFCKPAIAWAKTTKRRGTTRKSNRYENIENEEQEEEYSAERLYSADEIEFVLVDPVTGEENPIPNQNNELKNLINENYFDLQNCTLEQRKKKMYEEGASSNAMLSGILKSGTIQPSCTNFPFPERGFYLNSHYLITLFYHRDEPNNNDNLSLNDCFICADAFLPISSLLHYSLNFGLFLWYQNLLNENSDRELPSKFKIYEHGRCLMTTSREEEVKTNKKNRNNRNNDDNDDDDENSNNHHHDIFNCAKLHRQETPLSLMIEEFEMDDYEKLNTEALKHMLGDNVNVKVVVDKKRNKNKSNKKH